MNISKQASGHFFFCAQLNVLLGLMASQPLWVINAKSIFIHMNSSISHNSVLHKYNFLFAQLNVGSLFGFYGISNFVGYLMLNPFLYK